MLRPGILLLVTLAASPALGAPAAWPTLPRRLRRALPGLQRAALRLGQDLVARQREEGAPTTLSRGPLRATLQAGKPLVVSSRPLFGHQLRIAPDGRVEVRTRQGTEQVLHRLGPKLAQETVAVTRPRTGYSRELRGGRTRLVLRRLYAEGLHVTHVLNSDRQLVSTTVYDPLARTRNSYRPDQQVSELDQPTTARQLFRGVGHKSRALDEQLQQAPAAELPFELGDDPTLDQLDQAAQKAYRDRHDLLFRLAAHPAVKGAKAAPKAANILGHAAHQLNSRGLRNQALIAGARAVDLLTSEKGKTDPAADKQAKMALSGYVRALKEAGRNHEALALADRLLAAWGENTYELRSLAEAAHQEGRFHDALGYVERALATKNKPFRPSLHTLKKAIVDDLAAQQRIRRTRPLPDRPFARVGGLREVVSRLRELVDLPLLHPGAFEHLGKDPPRGLLLAGPPGTGKTLLARAVAEATGAHFIAINAAELAGCKSCAIGNLTAAFKEAKEKQPTIIFIDEIDALAPKRRAGSSELINHLLNLMSGFEDRGQVMVIGATNRPDDLSAAIRRPGRLDVEITVRAPNARGREAILRVHNADMPLRKGVDLAAIAEKTHGFTGADLELLVKEAVLGVTRRVMAKRSRLDRLTVGRRLALSTIGQQDLLAAKRRVTPSGLREGDVALEKVRWDDVGGYDAVKAELADTVIGPLRDRSAYERLKLELPKGVLLVGPPGTGKTYLARALATEANANFIGIKASDLRTMWRGEEANNVAKLFGKARGNAPVVLFIDELDAIAPVRAGHGTVDTEMTNELLVQIDGLARLKDVIVVAATNREDRISRALLQRFETRVEVPLPNEKDRAAVFAAQPQRETWGPDVDLGALARRTEGFSCREIAEKVCQRAGRLALRRNPQATVVTMADLEQAIDQVIRSRKQTSRAIGFIGR